MKYRYTDEQLRSAVAKHTSISSVMAALGIRWAGGSHCNIRRRIERAQIDTSHFSGQGHRRGKAALNRRHWSDILIDRSGIGYRREQTDRLRRALLESGRIYECELCTNAGDWNGRTLVLEIDHRDRNWLDDRAENLRFLCPNCHSQV